MDAVAKETVFLQPTHGIGVRHEIVLKHGRARTLVVIQELFNCIGAIALALNKFPPTQCIFCTEVVGEANDVLETSDQAVPLGGPP